MRALFVGSKPGTLAVVRVAEVWTNKDIEYHVYKGRKVGEYKVDKETNYFGIFMRAVGKKREIRCVFVWVWVMRFELPYRIPVSSLEALTFVLLDDTVI